MEPSGIEIDNYGCITIPTPLKEWAYDSYSVISSGLIVYINNAFFESHCYRNEDGTRSLMLRGGYVFSKINRHFESWDAPYLPHFLRKNQDVTKIDLSYNKISADGLKFIIGYVANSDHVEELDLSYNDIEEKGMVHLQREGEKLKLKVLKLSGNKMGYECAKEIAMIIQKNNYIERLEVADMDQTEESLIYFITILRPEQECHNKSLKAVDLSRPILKNLYYIFNSLHIATTIGCMLRTNETLEELYLQKFGFSCHDIEAMLVNSQWDIKLTILDLSCNNIGDHGMELLSKWILQRPPLQVLLLAHNNFTNHGIRALSRGISFSKIIILDVSHNRFGDEGCIELLHSIQKYPMLEQLQIWGNKIGRETAEIIRWMLESDILNQDYIDVQVYEVDEILHIAYQECQSFLNPCNESVV